MPGSQAYPFAPPEIVMVAGDSMLAYPRGRHQLLRSAKFSASVCVPLWNEAPVVERALASLVAQTWRDFAIVIVDNASHDGGHDRACRFADVHSNAVVYQCGQSIARTSLWNRSLDLALGDYTKVLEASDYLLPGFLAAALGALAADPELAIVRVGVTALRMGRLLKSSPASSSCAITGMGALVRSLTSGNFIGPASSHLMRRAALEAPALRYRSDLSHSAAIELALRLFSKGDFGFVQAPLVVFDEDAPRTFNEYGARGCFREECEARLSVLRSGQLHLPAATLVRTLQHVTQLFEQYANRAEEEGQSRELESDFAMVITELGALLRSTVQQQEQGADDARSEVSRMLAAAEREARAQHLPEAEAQLRNILTVAPWHPLALGGLGRMRMLQSDPEGARKYFLSALAMDPALELVPGEAMTLTSLPA